MKNRNKIKLALLAATALATISLNGYAKDNQTLGGPKPNAPTKPFKQIGYNITNSENSSEIRENHRTNNYITQQGVTHEEI